MLRILQLGLTDTLGGIETFIMNYYRFINHSKIQFDFINIYDKELCFESEIKSLGGHIYKVTSYYKNPFKYIKELTNIIKDNNYEIVHINMNSSVFLYGIIAAHKANAKIIVHAHNNHSDKGLIKSIIHKINRSFLKKYTNNFIACSNYAGKWFFKENNFLVFNNAIDMSKFKYNENIRKKKRNELKIPENAFVIGHVGRLVKVKNHEFLLKIFKEISTKNENAILILVGDGPLKEKLQKLAIKYNIESKVKFLGSRCDVNELMQTMDIFAFPSFYEGLGTVLIEAQAAGLPVVTTPNIPKEANISSAFYKIPLDNSTAWQDAILKYRDCPRQTAQNATYDIKVWAKKLKDYYYKLEKGE